MITVLAYVAAAIFLFGLGYVAVRAVWSYIRHRGTRLVICPETQQPAAVAIDARLAAEGAVLGTPQLLLSECSRWPERRNCGQACLRQIELAPEECLVKNIVGHWYAEKRCAYCSRPFDSIEDIFHHKPALMSSQGRTFEWDEVKPETLPQVMSTCLPVCWSCHMAETFRREHKDVILDNPWQPRHEGGPVETATHAQGSKFVS